MLMCIYNVYTMYIGILARSGGGAAVVHQGQHQRQAAERQRYTHMSIYCIIYGIV